MQHRLIGAAGLAVVAWLAAIVAAVAFIVPLFPRQAIQASFALPFPFEARPTPDMFAEVFLIGLAFCVPAGALIGVVAYRRAKQARTTVTWIAVGVGSGVLTIPVVLIMAPNTAGLSLAVPGAVCVVWVLHRLQRYRRLPVPVSLAAFACGATFAMTVGILLQQLHVVAANTYVVDSIAQAYVPRQGVVALVEELAAPVWEEFAKAAAVVLIYRLTRDRYRGVVHGIVIGGLVGAGFNTVETVRFAHTTFEIAMQQIWIRQWLGGFLFGHVLFTAAVGAAVALADSVRHRAGKLALWTGGLTAAVGAHYAWNHSALITGLPWRSADPLQQTLFMAPLNYLTLSGPLLLVVTVILWIGLRLEAARLGATVRVEALTGYDAITPEETATLLVPKRRLGERILAIRTHGPLGYFRVGRLHAAQLDLAMERWRAGHESPHDARQEDALRRRVHTAKQDLVATAKGGA